MVEESWKSRSEKEGEKKMKEKELLDKRNTASFLLNFFTNLQSLFKNRFKKGTTTKALTIYRSLLQPDSSAAKSTVVWESKMPR